MNKTLETLKAVARRAPKHRVTVKRETLPAPKPRSLPCMGNGSLEAAPIPVEANETAVGTERMNRPNSVCSGHLDPAPTISAATPTDSGAEPGVEATTTPVHSAMRVGRYPAGVVAEPEAGGTVQPLPGDPEMVGRASSPPPRKTVLSSMQPTAPIGRSAVLEHAGARLCVGGTGPAVAPSSADTDAFVDTTAQVVSIPLHPLKDIVGVAPSTASIPAPPPEVTGAPGGSLIMKKEVEGLVFMRAPSDTKEAVVEALSPGVIPRGGASTSLHTVLVDASKANFQSACTSKERKVSDTNLDSPEAAHPAGVMTSDMSPTGDATRPAENRVSEKPKAGKCPAGVGNGAGTFADSLQLLPTTGYQFEHMWRSAVVTSDARLKLLRAIPPSSLVKIFRRTPLEVELLEGILEHLGVAFLPGRPVTALRWLKNLSKASRFGMTASLMGEGEGKRAVRELLGQLEASAQLAEVEELRKQYMC